MSGSGSRLKQLAYFGGSLSLAAVGCVSVGLYMLQDKMIYIPTPNNEPADPESNKGMYKNPGQRGLPYEDVWFDA
jgi:hypothetical protein